MTEDRPHVGILGAGLMGSGIAQACAVAGYQTTVRDISDGLLARGRAGIVTSLDKLIEKGKLTAAERDAALARLSFTTELSALADSGLVIEAVTEDLAVKNELWRALDRLCGPAAIFASNTSSLSIASMAMTTRRPDRFVGLHFFNPVPLMPLVEVVRTATTSDECFDRAMAFGTSLGKEVVAAKDSPGFIVNRLLVPYLLDAIRALEQGVASTADIDTAMKLGAGHPMGPLRLADLVGLDTLARVAGIMFAEYQEDRYAPPAILERLVGTGMLGRKSGMGFYDYATDPPTPTADLHS
ncbi:MAG: 3-hydroxybutyryl-CoA dehydrogenase [Gemmatimonadota bacterium]